MQKGTAFVTMNLGSGIRNDPMEDKMNQDILSILQEKKSGFSKGQRLIAKYITEEYDKAAL